jgi:hypothetical protein
VTAFTALIIDDNKGVRTSLMDLLGSISQGSATSLNRLRTAREKLMKKITAHVIFMVFLMSFPVSCGTGKNDTGAPAALRAFSSPSLTPTEGNYICETDVDSNSTETVEF